MVQANSPIAITHVGQEVAKKLKVEDILNRIYPDIKKEIPISSNENAYDIQQKIFDYFNINMEKHLTDAELN